MKTTKLEPCQMKAALQLSKSVVFAAILACLIVAGAGSAFAATDPILRSGGGVTLDGQCCFSWGESVSIAESATIKPAIVTWNADYEVNVADAYFAGLSVNGGECQTAFYGPRVLADNPGPGSAFTSITFQWVVLPTDGELVTGANTFELCGGGKNSSSDSISIGENTLMVVLGK